MSEIPVIVSFPLPFRVLVLSGLGILGWATNLHGLDLLGVDAVAAMDLQVETSALSHLPHHLAQPKRPSHPSVIYNAVYRLFLGYSLWVFMSWASFRWLTYGDAVLVDAFGYIPAVSGLVLLMVLISPVDALCKRERDKFLHALRRCVFTHLDGPIYFADVIFADIFTSFAKVLGDMWLSACMLLPGNTLLSTPADSVWLRWVMPTIMSLPYLIRLKQCIAEYSHAENESRRPLLNAIKYASSFPVIYLSAAQRIVVSELVEAKGSGVTNEAWHGEHPLFRLWLLAAIVNSLYSFWWDVTNDWGLTLLKPTPEETDKKPAPPRQLLLSQSGSHSPHGSQDETATNHQRESHPYGLRSMLLYPLPVYPLLIFLNLVLRLTWSVKLSSHLHSKSEGSVTIFWLEMAEVIRRWMWVFLRVEWEVVKKGQEGARRGAMVDEYSGDEAEYEMVYRAADDS
ncbi:unnamed protein product [Mycena citricolor]|uniref:EXS domain-containing protein n=1 Tax=Mycena citricolor TaxID=2018698 RepID=A0AAD2HUK5_9AGAR|nr:unnamed protein product [Mycena citricolor]